jgi:hypothetical protein
MAHRDALDLCIHTHTHMMYVHTHTYIRSAAQAVHTYTQSHFAHMHIHTHTFHTHGISRGCAGLSLEKVSRPARPRHILYAITFWGVTHTFHTRTHTYIPHTYARTHTHCTNTSVRRRTKKESCVRCPVRDTIRYVCMTLSGMYV